MTPSNEEIEQMATTLKGRIPFKMVRMDLVADMLLALKVRAETAEKALQEIVDNTSERSLANNIARAALEAKP